MFDRRFYKKSAKNQLRGRLGTAALATLVSFAIMAIITATPAAETINYSTKAIPASYAVTDSTVTQTAQIPSYGAPGFNPDISFSSVPFIIVLFYLAVTGILSFSLCHLFNVYYSNPSKFRLLNLSAVFRIRLRQPLLVSGFFCGFVSGSVSLSFRAL